VGFAGLKISGAKVVETHEKIDKIVLIISPRVDFLRELGGGKDEDWSDMRR
jgi:hypothetical protein